MSKLVRVVAVLFSALLPAIAEAQVGGTITGRVIEGATQRPVSEAQVMVVGTQRGTTTDQQGRYTLAGLGTGQYQIRVRRIGYAQADQLVTVGTGAVAVANFSLTAAAAQLQEVVVNAVTGALERRVEVGTNVGHVNVANLDKGPITKMADILQARVAGVTLQSTGGATGAGQRIRVRGANSLSLSNEPLLYVDGILVSNGKGGIDVGGGDYSRLNDLNPEEIENIEILKGPAASAIYGSAAANGVLLITTKKGHAGAPVWRAYAEGGQLKDINQYPLNYAALTRVDPTSTNTNYFEAFEGDTPGFVYLNTASTGFSGAPFALCHNYAAAAATNPCKQDVLLSFDQFRDPRTTPFVTGMRDKLGLSVSGGSDALTYFMSGDREEENGVLRPNNLKRLSLRTNLNARISSKATAAISAAYINSNHRRLGSDNNIFSPLLVAFHGPAEYIPGMETDTLGSGANRPGSLFGPNYVDQQKYFANQDVDRYIIGANTNITPLGWLRVNGNIGLDYYGRQDKEAQDPNVLPIDQSFTLGFRDAYRASNYQWTSNLSAAATFTPVSSVVSTTTVGTSYSRQLFEQVECFGVAIPSGTASCAAATTQFAIDETHTDLKSIGGLIREELAIRDRLFLSGSLRADNNSGLVRDVSGLSYYPSFNASWLISDEGFFPKAGFLNQLRLRAGWGQAGQRPGFGQSESFFGSRGVSRAGTESPALILTATGNPALKVERTTELEGGFDLGLFDNRLQTEFTAFTRRSKDALISRNLAPSSGLTGAVFQNLGSVKNWGTELGLNLNAIQSSKVNFDVRLTASTLQNRIEELGEGIAPIRLNRGEQFHREGFSAGGFFARPLTWNDANGDGKLSTAEVTVDTARFLKVPNAKGGIDTLALAYLGPLLPTNQQGLSFDLTLFKNLTFSTLFERRAGNKQLNETEYFRCRTQHANPYFGFCQGLDDPHASLQQQAAFIGSQFSQFGATPYGYIEDAGFVKWREISFRLDIPSSVGSRLSALRGASITLAGRNLKTWTNYTGLDPEINESGGGNFNQNEFNTQPPVRTWNLRFDFKL
ncbi:MAG TPA: SusC/RagA family TonB-linked outer membrane protein [Gemmatimonadaceae bacterium]|nr:SusC/RagA family TonB-linked outer membrane protein [Gemmatimonadaceae bacterium]